MNSNNRDVVIISTKVCSEIAPSTKKYTLQLQDNSVIEAVAFAKPDNPVCLSTQVGCPIGCVFCESGKNGLGSNLSAQEIVAQFSAIQNDLLQDNRQISYLLLHGAGEPLLNYDSCLGAIKELHSQHNGNLRFSISTVGIIKGIRQLPSEQIPIDLYVSLHGTNNEQRRRLIPYAKHQNVSDLLQAINFYSENGLMHLPVSIQYLLLDGINDSVEDAQLLVKYFSKRPCRVVLKKICPTTDLKDITTSHDERFKFFYEFLTEKGVSCIISASQAREIEGGCGQLRAKFLQRTTPKG